MTKKIIATGLAFFALALFSEPPAKAVMDWPESVEIDSLAGLYGPVSFDHAMHVDVVENDCSICHHHTTGTPVTDERCARCHANSGATDAVACSDCHAANRFAASYLKSIENKPMLFHTDKPGLKGAFHLRCLNCHREMDAPSGCEDCHARNDTGQAFYRTGPYAPTPPAKTSHGED